MAGTERATLEHEIHRLHAEGAIDAATTAAIQGYGPELLGFVCALMRDSQAGSDVFSQLCVDVWHGLPAFAWQCSFRTWSYTLARHATHRYRRDESRRAAKQSPLAQQSVVDDAVMRVRTATLPFLKTETRSRIAMLRDSLPEDDQALLILRVDKRLEWNDLAHAMNDSGQPLTGAGLRRESARLRKRFQLVKDRLRELAKREGLLDGDG